MTIDGTFETIDDRPALRFERTLARSVDRVWRAVSDPSELEHWFPAAADWTPEVGETIEVEGMTGEVTDVDKPHRLARTFNGERYSFDLTAEGDGCRLVFIHVFDDRAIAAQTATGWDIYLSKLEPHLRGEGVSDEEAFRPWAEMHERYAERFDIDPTPGRKFAKSLPKSD